MVEKEKDALDPRISLEVIREVIELAKKNTQENGFHFLLWGVVITASALANWYLLNVTDAKQPWLPWLILPLIGGISGLVYEWRRERGGRSQNIINKWYGLVWLGFLPCLVVAIFFSVRGGLSPIPVVLLLAAFATFVSGILLQFAPLVWGSSFLWLGALLCLFVLPQHHGLVMAAAILLGYLAPGWMLQQRARKQHG